MKAVISFKILGRAKDRSEVECRKEPEDGIKDNNKSIAETVCLEVSEGREIWLTGMVGSMMEVKGRTALRGNLVEGSQHLKQVLLMVISPFWGGLVE